MSASRATGLAALLGAASVAGFAPVGLFPLPLVALALQFRLWRQAPTPRRAAWLGLAWGLGFFLTGVSWIYVSLHDVGGMAAPLAALATLLFCIWLALFPALAGYGFRRLAGPGLAPSRAALVGAGLWTLSEWLRGTLFTGFPWLALGYSQSPPSPLAGYAPLIGSYGLGFLAALLAALTGLCWRRRWPGPWASAIVLAVFAFGFVLRAIAWTEPVGAPLQVALLQGNVAQSLKWEAGQLQRSIDAYLRLAAVNPAPLIVLPETAIPLPLDDVPPEVLQALTANGEALLGVVVRTTGGHDAHASRGAGAPGKPAAAGYANAAVALQAGGRIQGYAKSHLVPFGEFAPPGFAWFLDLVRIPMSNFTPGPARQPPLDVAGQKIMPDICYEDLFGEEIIRALPTATLLINLSNTAWFGDSLAQPQHLQIARLRALETGRPMLRATNTGMTAAIAPDGTVAAMLPPFTRAALQVEVRGHRGMTPYARRGNAPTLFLALLACLAALRRRPHESR